MTPDEPNWPPLWSEIIREQRWGVENEFIAADQLKLRFTAEDLDTVKSDRGLPRLISSSKALRELNQYLRSLLRRHYETELGSVEMEDLLLALDFSFDRIVCFEDPLLERVVHYPYDLDAWITSDSAKRLREFRSNASISYRLCADERLLHLVEESEKQLGDLADALYLVRRSMLFGRSGDRLYTYQRVPLTTSQQSAHLVAEQNRHRRQAAEHHSQIATR